MLWKKRLCQWKDLVDMNEEKEKGKRALCVFGQDDEGVESEATKKKRKQCWKMMVKDEDEQKKKKKRFFVAP